MSYRNPPVVIIGAGVGGLTLALLLRQRGIAAEVLEQSAELREAGAAVGLAANATRVLRFLGLGEDLARVSTEPTRLIHRDGRDGRIVAASRGNRWYREAFGAPFYGLHRMALQRLLAGAFGPGTCTSAAGSRRWRRPGGHAAALRVGDRFRSRRCRRCRRRALRRPEMGRPGLGDQRRRAGVLGHVGVTRPRPGGAAAQPARPGALQFWMGPGAHLLHYPIDGGRVVNFLAAIDGPPRWTAPAWLEEAAPGARLAPFADWHPAVTEMLAAVPQSPRWGLFARRPLARWTAPRGPARRRRPTRCCRTRARAPTRRSRTPPCWPPNSTAPGVPAGVPAALGRYAARRRVRTRQVRLVSWAASAALHLPDGPAAQRRDASLPGTPRDLAWIHG